MHAKHHIGAARNQERSRLARIECMAEKAMEEKKPAMPKIGPSVRPSRSGDARHATVSAEF
jgi:hypothetical protein